MKKTTGILKRSVAYSMKTRRKSFYQATDRIDKVFSGRQPRLMIYELQRFGDEVHLQHQGGDGDEKYK
jgi:hypothetical protein